MHSVVNTDVATVGYVVPQSDCSAMHIALNSEGQICSASILLGQDLEEFICLVPAADKLDSQVASTSNSQNRPTDLHNIVSVEVCSHPKRQRGIINSSTWKQNICKGNCRSGKSYLNRKGAMEAARWVQQRFSCVQCKFKCIAKITEDMKSETHSSFWSMSDELKFSFYELTTQKVAARWTSFGKQSKKIFLQILSPCWQTEV